MSVLVNKETRLICQGFTGLMEHFTLSKQLNMEQN